MNPIPSWLPLSGSRHQRLSIMASNPAISLLQTFAYPFDVPQYSIKWTRLGPQDTPEWSLGRWCLGSPVGLETKDDWVAIPAGCGLADVGRIDVLDQVESNVASMLILSLWEEPRLTLSMVTQASNPIVSKMLIASARAARLYVGSWELKA